MSFRLRSDTDVNNPPGHHVSLNLGEPRLDLVEPGRVGRSKGQMNLRVLGQELVDPCGLVRREVVSDDMDLLASKLVGHNVSQEGDELRRGVALGRLAQHLARLHIERRIQRQRAVAEGLEAVPPSATRQQRQHRILAIERMDRRFLVFATHRRVLWRVQGQTNDIGGLGLEIRVVRTDVPLQTRWLEAMLGPNPGHRHVREGAAHLGCQLMRGSVRRAIGWVAFSRPDQHPCFETLGNFITPALRIPGEQSGQPIGLEPPAPATEVAVAAIQLRANLGPGEALGYQQDQAGVPGPIGSNVPPTALPWQFHGFALGPFHHCTFIGARILPFHVLQSTRFRRSVWVGKISLSVQLSAWMKMVV